MDTFHVTFVVLFLMMAVVRFYYRLKARTGGKEQRTTEPATALARIFVGGPAMLAVLVYLFRPQMLNWSSVPLRPAWRWAGAAIFAASVAGLAWVHSTLGKNFSSELRIRSDHALVTSGPYRYVRHPMYTAFLLLFTGMGLLAANWFIGAAGLLAYFLIMLSRISREEEMMVNAFGDQYRRYASTTGRFFPRVRPNWAKNDLDDLIGVGKRGASLRWTNPERSRWRAAAPTQTFMAHKVTLIPGDGIGPEVIQATVRMIEATGVKFEWESFAAGAEAFEKYHEYIPKELSESIERTRVGLKGPVTTPIGGGFSSINVELRRRFELFANFRPIRNLPHIPTRYPGVDLIVVRENTEGLYSGIEHEVVPGVVESIKVITEKASTRVSRFAFEHARKNKRKKIHCIHKANIMKLSDGLFLRCSRNVSKEYPEIFYGEHIVDNTCMQLVMNPYQYDMLLLENFYGDIISDLCAGLVGGLGLVPGANFGHECAIFEAVHGSAPDIAGRNIANPTAVLRSALLMLRHLGEPDAAWKIRNAIDEVYRDRSKLTRDVGGNAGTSEFADAIIQAMESQSAAAAGQERL